MRLYHFTSLESYVKIAESGYIDVSSSNLLPPDRATMEIRSRSDGSFYYWDKNSEYKPVVWLTTSEFADPQEQGLSPAKCVIRLAVNYNALEYCKWSSFADENNMDKAWRASLEKGRAPETWYIRASRIPYSEIVESVMIETQEEHCSTIKKGRRPIE